MPAAAVAVAAMHSNGLSHSQSLPFSLLSREGIAVPSEGMSRSRKIPSIGPEEKGKRRAEGALESRRRTNPPSGMRAPLSSSSRRTTRCGLRLQEPARGRIGPVSIAEPRARRRGSRSGHGQEKEASERPGRGSRWKGNGERDNFFLRSDFFLQRKTKSDPKEKR